jgi:autotransporter passenger strand-loop-strand repeat protein
MTTVSSSRWWPVDHRIRVSFGNTVSEETITSGLTQTVLGGGTADSTTVAADGEQDVSGGTTNATVLQSGGM